MKNLRSFFAFGGILATFAAYIIHIKIHRWLMTTYELTAEHIFRTELLHLGNETKRRLIELLASSLTFPKTREKEDKDALLDKICGAWEDDGQTAEEEIKELRDSRCL